MITLMKLNARGMADLLVVWLLGYHWGIFGAKSGFLGHFGAKKNV